MGLGIDIDMGDIGHRLGDIGEQGAGGPTGGAES